MAHFGASLQSIGSLGHHVFGGFTTETSAYSMGRLNLMARLTNERRIVILITRINTSRYSAIALLARILVFVAIGGGNFGTFSTYAGDATK